MKVREELEYKMETEIAFSVNIDGSITPVTSSQLIVLINGAIYYALQATHSQSPSMPFDFV